MAANEVTRRTTRGGRRGPWQEGWRQRRAAAVTLDGLEARTLLSAVALDPDFGLGGVVTTDFAGGSDEAYAMAALPDGKFLVAGKAQTLEGGADMAVARFDADGTLDATFGVDGRVTLDLGSIWGDAAFSMLVQADGKVVLAGQTETGDTGFDFALVRLNPDGTPDGTFGNGGVVVTDFDGSFDQAFAVVQQADGKLLAAGVAAVDGNFRFAVARYEADGTLDASFGTAGLASADVSVMGGGAYAMALDAAGRIVVAGYAWGIDGADLAAMRFTVNGAPDATFGNGGLAVVDAGDFDDEARAVAVMGDGRIVLAGRAGGDFVAARLLDDGTPDASFGAGAADASERVTFANWGVVRVDFSDGGADGAAAMLLMDDGSLLLAGFADYYVDGDAALLKLTPDGTPDASFDDDGLALASFGSVDDGLRSVAFTAEGNLVGAGYVFGGGTDYDWALAAFALAPVAPDVPDVPDAPPVADAGGPYAVVSGQAVALDGSASADDAGIATYEWDLDYDGVSFDVDATGATALFSAAGIAGPAVRTVALRVTDAAGQVSVATAQVQVAAAGLTADAGEDVSALEGSRVQLTGRYANAAKGRVTYNWHVVADNGQVIGDGSGASFTFTPKDDGIYRVTFTVRDSAGAVASDEVIVTVVNVAPTVDAGADHEAQEGKKVSFTGKFSDASPADTHTILWRAVAPDGQVVAEASTRSFSFTPADDGVYRVTLTVTDDDGGVGTDEALLTVRNVAPRADAGKNVSGVEGSAVTLTGSATDAGSADEHTFEWTVRDANGAIVASGSGATFTFTPVDDGKYEATLVVTDDDGASDSAKVKVSVANAAPRVAVAGPASAVPGQAREYLGGFVDAGLLDSHEVSFDFGDGTRTSFVAATPEALRVSHAWASTGTYTVRMSVRDDDGAVSVAQHTVTVRAADLQQDPADFTKWALFVGGTKKADRIELRRVGAGQVEVRINNRSEGVFNPTGQIIAYGLAGNDVLAIEAGVANKVTFYGGEGNDSLSGSTGNATLFQ